MHIKKTFQRTLIHVIVLCLSGIAFIPIASGQQSQPIFYIATNGNDAWSGKLSEPDPGKTDGPFTTLERARDAIRQLKTSASLKTPVIIMVRGGEYYRTEPIVIRPEDSGTKECPVIYTAYPGEKPIIHGGKRITGWKRGKGNIWFAKVPEVKAGTWYFRQLFINGKRCRRARTPNEGILKITGGAEPKLQAFQFKPGDIKKKWTNIEDVEIIITQIWMAARLLIDRIDEINNTVWLTGSSWRPLTWNSGYFVENVYEGLDEPGEWYLNRETGIVYYMPRPGEDMNTAEIIAPVTDQLVRFEGDVDKGQYVQYVTFKDLAFKYTSWNMPEKGYAYPQAEVGGHPNSTYMDTTNVGSAIYANGIRHCSLENNEIAHLGTWGIELWQGCKDNQIVGNHFYDIGAGGIKIGDWFAGYIEPLQTETNEFETGNTTISDNIFHDGCRVYLGAPAVWIGMSSDNIIAHNEISGYWQWAVSVGWRWDLSPKGLTRNNIIEYNHIHDFGKGDYLNAHAAIYTLGLSPGTVVRCNLIHHITSWTVGIALDAGSGGILVEKNIVHHVPLGFHFNYGCVGNIILNNIFALTDTSALFRYGDRPPKGTINTNMSYRNIHYWKTGRLFFDRFDWPDFNTIRDYNLYFDITGKPIKFVNDTFEEWKAKGLDVNSLIADPLFVDPENGDFTLKPGSPAFKLGFKPIDLKSVGPRKR